MSIRTIGWIDARHRPLINLQAPNSDDPVPALVDTGFNGELLTDGSGADAFSCQLTGLYEEVEAVGGAPLTAIARATIIWHGRVRDVDIHIVLNQNKRRRGDPVAIIGTLLLNDSKLTIDFVQQIVEIEF
jgi:predicted aspartyl protease